MQRRTVLSVVGTTAPLGALGVGVASGHVGGARPDAPVERSAGMVARRGLRYARLPDRAGVLDLYRPRRGARPVPTAGLRPLPRADVDLWLGVDFGRGQPRR